MKTKILNNGRHYPDEGARQISASTRCRHCKSLLRFIGEVRHGNLTRKKEDWFPSEQPSAVVPHNDIFFENGFLSCTSLTIMLIALVACCNTLTAQGRGHGKIVISAVLYRASNPEQREFFNKFTYYIKDDLVLRKEDPEDPIFGSTTEEYNEGHYSQLTAKINTPTYLIALKTGQVYIYIPDSLKIHKISDLETFMDDVPFKAEKYLPTHYVISNMDTTSTAKGKTVANIDCFLGKAMLNGIAFEFAYSKEELPVMSPLNAYVPELPYQVLWISVPADHDPEIVSELIVEEFSTGLSHFVENYFGVYYKIKP